MPTDIPARGIWTDSPAVKWEDALVSGNGSHGVMVMGDPVSDTIIGNHCRLYLPQGNRFELPEMATYLTEFRQIIEHEGYDKALSFYYQKAEELGYPGLLMSDPSHPGFHLHVETDHSSYNDYQRSIDYQTGELTVTYQANGQAFSRKTFVSQQTNQIIHCLSPGEYKIHLQDYQHPLMKQTSRIHHHTMHTHFDYVHSEGGYDVRIDVEASNLQPLADETGFQLQSDQPILITMEISPYQQATDRTVIKAKVGKQLSYQRLFASHEKIHRELFDRVRLELATDEQRQQPIWSLVEQAKRADQMTPVLLEKMYDAGRYMFICSAGELTPNLQGIWTGTFEPAWSGDFTFDTNVQLSIAGALSSDLLEGLTGYFRLIKELLPGFRENAQKYYGARGILATAHSSNSGRHMHWNEDWPLVLWTCGAGWLAHWYYQYYRFTGDTIFLQNEAVPFLEEIVLFYQDFLIEDADGTYRFTPSYSAENGTGDNATQDIAVAKEVLTNLIEAYQILGYSNEKINSCQEMLEKLPAYQINQEGALKEWLTPDKGENYNHRHFSHLYPVFQSREFNDETDPVMWKASRIAFEKRLEAWLLNEEGDTSSTHGRMHSALCATQFHMPALIDDIFRLLITNNCFFSSLMMSHYNEQNIFNVDGNGAMPQVVHEMLVDYSNHRLTLLGAIPASIASGTIRGVRLPHQMTVHQLSWDLEANRLDLEIESQTDQELSLYLPLFTKSDQHLHHLQLVRNQKQSLHIDLAK
ncbi:glycosyl hydrolase family 95 catalytic domain-containing protein [Gracilibacillus salinarum]|uniref:Glycoside hydrolase family 95 protein n=1 Tax=Gracilibacillus salinarum TaxID=2932255 RepID=A0ABY4GLJ9_9BACI|nr:glycoside hydrolase N-terminal domain-containing protein [Gracilibacillus salinarum]UOQ85114.1 glycoside hydrolase family 95 protein [Gracilibacillus salinarum]